MGWVTRWELDDKASPEFKKAADKMNRAISEFERKTGKAGRAHTTSMKNSRRETDKATGSVKRLGSAVAALATIEGARRLGTEMFKMAKEADSARLAMMGLKRVAEGTGQQFADVEKVMQTAGQGMLKFNTRATGLRNLMLAGLGAKEAAEMMDTFVDIASIGRSSTINLSDAVLNLTQAFKTEQSELGDLSGMTANFSEILKVGADEAERLGLNLDRAGVKMLGIEKLHETLEGAAVDATTGLAGATNELTLAWEQFRLEVGKELEPQTTGLVRALTGAVRMLTPTGQSTQNVVDEFMERQREPSYVRPAPSAPMGPFFPPGGILGAGSVFNPELPAPPRPVMVPEEEVDETREFQAPFTSSMGSEWIFKMPDVAALKYREIEASTRSISENMRDWGIDALSDGIADIVVNFNEIEDVGEAILSLFGQITKELAQWAFQLAIKEGIETAFGLSDGGTVPGFAGGGVVGPSYFDAGGMARGTDTVPAMLTPGEGVLTRDTVRNLGGAGAIDAINQGQSLGVSQEIHIHGPVAGDGGIRALAAMLHPHTRSLIRSNGFEGLS